MKDNMSFAKDNWEEFEKLSLSILETYLPTDSEFSYSITHTPHRKDGGYDGLIIISSSDENIDQYKILSESKLRELSNKDLPIIHPIFWSNPEANIRNLIKYILYTVDFSISKYRIVFNRSS